MKIELDIAKIHEIKKNGLGIEDFLYLWLTSKGVQDLVVVSADPVLLSTNGWLYGGSWGLTNKAKLLISSIISKVEEPKDIRKSDYEAIYVKLIDRMVKLTGKKQKVIDNKYSFLPNKQDFVSRLESVCKKYGLKDAKKIENTLLNYLDHCKKSNWKYCKLLNYYILKDGVSTFVTDYECSMGDNNNDTITTEERNQHFDL